jgi:hypothetical protein
MPENYVLLERTELNASASSVTFSNIPQTGYTDLKIVVSARTSNTNGYTGGMSLRFNGSSTAVYSHRELLAATSTPSSGSGSSLSYMRLADAVGSSLTASTFGNQEIYIPNYTGSTNKSVSVDGVAENNASTDYTWQEKLLAGLWGNTAAITSVTLFGGDAGTLNFLAGSTFSLYGIAALGTTPAIAPKASGGNVIENDGTYWIHTFLNSGTFTPAVALSCDVLVVAGGGGAGSGAGGGGGAGGFRASTGNSVTATSYAVTIGAGGTGGAGGAANRGAVGSDSVFNTITSAGGGFGGAHAQSIAAGNGGSGGGAGGGGNSNNTAGSASPSGQGNNGGIAFNSSGAYGGGGGGGATAAGSNGSSSAGGNGGNGTANSYSGTSVTYAGGGGAGTYSGGGGTFNGGTGGTGGGGNAATTTNASGANGTTNLGGGGGAGTYTSAYGAGGNGGSGIIIIRYPITA